MYTDRRKQWVLDGLDRVHQAANEIKEKLSCSHGDGVLGIDFTATREQILLVEAQLDDVRHQVEEMLWSVAHIKLTYDEWLRDRQPLDLVRQPARSQAQIVLNDFF